MKINVIIMILVLLMVGCSSEDDSNPVIQPEPVSPEIVKVIHEDALIISNQSDIDLVKEKGYTHITGALEIAGYNGQPITSLVGLESIIEASHLTIHSSELTNLKGLENLTKLEKGLQILRTNKLQNLNELKNVKFIGGVILISENTELSNFDAISNADMGNIHNVTIINNEKLLSIKGLKGLTSTESDLILGNNPNLANLKGLENLGEVGWELGIYASVSINNLLGLSGLNKVRNINLYNNANLGSLEGVETLRVITERLIVMRNPKLTNFCSISNLTGQAPLDWTIRDNQFNPTKDQLITGNCKQ